MTGDAIGSLMVMSGTIILALAALYHIIPLATATDQGWWSAPPLWSSFLSNIFFLSGEGFHWPGLTVGALLGVLGIIIWACPRVRIPGRSGKGIRALLLIGGLIILAGAIAGALPTDMAVILAPEGQAPSQTIYGRHAFLYMALVLTGLTVVLSAAAWASWKGGRPCHRRQAPASMRRPTERAAAAEQTF